MLSTRLAALGLTLLPLASAGTDLTNFQVKTQFIQPQCLYADRIANASALWLSGNFGNLYLTYNHIAEGGIDFNAPVTYDPGAYTGLSIDAAERASSQRGDQRDLALPTATTVFQLRCGSAGVLLNSFWFDRPGVLDPYPGVGGPFAQYGVTWPIPSNVYVHPDVVNAVNLYQPSRIRIAPLLRPFSTVSSDLVLQARLVHPGIYKYEDILGAAIGTPVGQLVFNTFLLDTKSGKLLNLLVAVYDDSPSAGGEGVGSAGGSAFIASSLAIDPMQRVRSYSSTSPYSELFQFTQWAAPKFFRVHVTRQNLLNAVQALNAGMSTDLYDYILTDAYVFNEIFYNKGPTATNARDQWELRDNISMGVAVMDYMVYEAVSPPLPGWSGFVLTPHHVDFNADSRYDMAWSHANGLHGVWLMQGASPSPYLVSSPATSAAIKVGDFNGDSNADILWRAADGSYYVSLMTGSTVAAVGQVQAAGNEWEVFGKGYFNGDSTVDLLARRVDGSYAIWLMNGLAAPVQSLLASPGPEWEIALVGDFNDDGKSDILWRNAINGSVQVNLMDGATVATAGTPTAVSAGWEPVQSDDFSGDGRADLLWRRNDGSTGIWIMNGTVATSYHLVPLPDWVTAIGDFNGDGKFDLLWQDAIGGAAVYLMDGGNVASSGYHYVGPGWSPVRVYDFDGNGKFDVLWRHTDGRHETRLMNGTSASAPTSVLGPNTGWELKP